MVSFVSADVSVVQADTVEVEQRDGRVNENPQQGTESRSKGSSVEAAR